MLQHVLSCKCHLSFFLRWTSGRQSQHRYGSEARGKSLTVSQASALTASSLVPYAALTQALERLLKTRNAIRFVPLRRAIVANEA